MSAAPPPAAFYCVADERYFLGAVGLVNSLRLAGHDEPIFMLDCGLTPGQRELLASQVTLIEAPSDAPPWLLKTVAPLRHPADVQMLIDTDMIVMRSLAELVERAAGGELVAFENDRDRFVAEWGELLGLGAVTRRPYVSSGLVLMGEREARQTLPLLEAARDEVDFERTFWRRNERDYPFLFADQDVLNAILCACDEPERIAALDHRLAANPPFRGLRLEDAPTLDCAYGDGTRPYVLHHFARKPWLVAMRASVYTRLLTRLLLGDDVALRLDAGELPLRLRTGPAAAVARHATDVFIGAPSYVRRRLEEHRGGAW